MKENSEKIWKNGTSKKKEVEKERKRANIIRTVQEVWKYTGKDRVENA